MLMSMIAEDAERTPSDVWQDGFINFKDLKAGAVIPTSEVLVRLECGPTRRDVILHGVQSKYIMVNPDDAGTVIMDELIKHANSRFAPGARARREADEADKK